MNAQTWVDRLTQLGLAVRTAAAAARDVGGDLAAAVAHEGGDTIFAIDRKVEPVLIETVTRWIGPGEAVLLIAEGLGQTGKRWIGPPDAASRVRLLVDPIDGTRGLMYDKRAAWFLAAVAPDRGDATRLSHAVASVMVELPTSKQAWADQFAATVEGPAAGVRQRLGTVDRRDVPIAPSRAATLLDGFAQVANFFPGTKVLASELMEAIATAAGDGGMVFDDQYMSTGGQMVELMLGRDRFCCDLRPLFYRILESHGRSAGRGLECHPYDAAGMLVAQRAGVILTDGFGRPLDGPMDVHTGIHWCGYANGALRERIEPVIGRWLREKGIDHAAGA